MGCGTSSPRPIVPVRQGRPPEGLKASFLSTFVERNGGRGKFMTLNAGKVVERMIVPQTAHLQASYCELLRKQGKTEGKDSLLGPATWYISYSSQSDFLSVADAILDCQLIGKDEFIFFDVFCMSHHEQVRAKRPTNWFTSTVPNNIINSGQLLLAMPVWDNTSPLGRAIVLLDVHTCLKNGGRFEIALPAKERKRMLEDLSRDSGRLSKVISQIPSSKGAECQRKHDQFTILDILQKESGGFEKLDTFIKSVVLGWYEAQFKNLIGTPNSRPDGNEVEASRWMLVLGGILLDAGKMDEALAYSESGFEIRKRVLGDADVSTFAAMDRVAKIYDSLHKYDKALPLYADCLKKYENVMGPDHPHTIGVKLNLAQLYQHWGKYPEALPMYQQLSESIQKVLKANPYTVGLPDLQKVQSAIDLVKKLCSGSEGAKRRGSKTGLDISLQQASVDGQAPLQRRGSKTGLDVAPELLGAMMKRAATNGLDLDNPQTKGAAVLSRRGSKNGMDMIAQ